MRRPVSALIVAIAALSIAAPPATAGGSVLDGPRDVGIGDVITLRGSFGSGSQARVSEGPWYGYLIRERGTGPATRVLLGPVGIRKSERYGWVASITFTVPNVPQGSYLVHVCDLGCHTGVGDLIGGYVSIATTAEQARYLRKLANIRFWLERARGDRARLKDAAIENEGRIESLEQKAASLEVQLLTLADRQDRTAATLAKERDRAAGYLVSTIALGAALLMALIALFWVGFRRRPRPGPRRDTERATPQPGRAPALQR